jgi:predicted ATPase
VIVLSTEHGLTDWLAWATSLDGWAMAGSGFNKDGIAKLCEGLAASQATGAQLLRPYFLALLAEAFMATGSLGEALGALSEVLQAAEEHEIRHYEAEAHRLKGELLLRQNNSSAAEARRCFERAVEIAGKQSAKSFELRATTGLARLLDQQGRRDEARTKLAAVYNWFTEGFDTPDLKHAKQLLAQLAG